MHSSIVLLIVGICGYASARGFGDFGQMSGSLTSSVNGGPAKVIPLDSPEACPFCQMLQRTMCNGGMMMNSPICTKCGKNCSGSNGGGNRGNSGNNGNSPWGGMGDHGSQGHNHQGRGGHRHHGNEEEQQNGGFPSPSRGEEADDKESGPSQGFKRGGPQGGSPPANPSAPAPGR